MFFMIFNAVLSAALFVLVVVPPLFIYNPSKHPGESHGPPAAGKVIAGDEISHSVKQKLYMLFVIPACAVANVIVLYFTHYRPIRGVQFRVEANVVAIYAQRTRARKELLRSGFSGLAAPVSTFSFANNSRIFFAGDRSAVPSVRSTMAQPKPAGTSTAAGGDTHVVEPLRRDDFRRRARPKHVPVDSYVHSSLYPEVRRLMDAVETSFLTPASAAVRNFSAAVARITGESPPGVAGAGSAPGVQMSVVEGPSGEGPTPYYSSRRTLGAGGADASASPGGVAGGGGSGGDVRSGTEPAVAGKVPDMRKRQSGAYGGDLEDHVPKRTTSVVLLPSDRHHARRASQTSAAGGGGGSSTRRATGTQARLVSPQDALEASTDMSPLS